MTAALKRQLDADGVLMLTLDVPDEKMNTLGPGVMGEFRQLLDELEAADGGVKAVVLASGKPDNFIAGADIKEFVKLKSAAEAEALSRDGHAILRRLEKLSLPTVAAIHGACLGGGLETALACRYRVASDDPKTALGLPEVMLGLIPGLGGTQRLPRLVGLTTALDLILTGRSLRASRLLRAGLADEVVPASILLEVARRAALDLVRGRLRPRRRGIPLAERLARPFIFRKARASVMKKTGGHYPAPLAAVDVIEEGSGTSLDKGIELEARAFGELAVTSVSRSLVSVFFATQEIKKDAGYPETTPVTEVSRLGVLGAGLMGAGIAGVAADVGVPVRIKDATPAALGRGLKYIHDNLEERRRRRLTGLEARKRLDRVSPTLDYSGFGRIELVIEAVFEDVEVKRKVLAEAEAASSARCVFASNTSSIPIGEIARDARRKDRVLGMHFFSPVHKMPLLEVIVTPETGAEAVATAVSFGRRLGKHVITVNDGPGFYTTRALAPYLNEGARLVEEGARIEDVDRALTAFGFPVGPVTLLDEVGIDVGAKVAKILYQAFGARLMPPASMEKIVADGRQGRKNKRGFYVYEGKKRVDESVYALLPTGAERRSFDVKQIQERLVFAFLNEAVLCLEQGILRSPRDGDVGAIFGLGFPPFLGGPFRYLDQIGARVAVETLERLRERHGERFEPAGHLRELARSDGHFHAGSA